MMDIEKRNCKVCGYEVIRQDISDVHSPGVVQFVAIVKDDSLNGFYAVVEKCRHNRHFWDMNLFNFFGFQYNTGVQKNGMDHLLFEKK